MIDHVSIQCSDVLASAAFYDVVLEALGYGRVAEFGEIVGYGEPSRPTFWLGPWDSGTGFRETHFAFAARDRASVVSFFDAAVAAGAAILHSPQLWPLYHDNYYGAFVRDPDGNNVEAVCHLPE